MKGKLLSSFLFAVFLALSVVSALSFSGSLSGENAIGLYSGQNASVSITNSESSAVTPSYSFTSTVSGVNLVVSANPTTISAGGSSAVNVLVQSVTGSFNVGDTVSTTLNASNGTASLDALIPLTLVRSFCSEGSKGGNLEITEVDIKSDGDEDETWKPLDTVTITVEFENVGDDDIKDIFVELGLYDENGRNQIGDLEFSNSDEEENDYGKLKDGDDDQVEFEFVVPADFDEGDYKLVVKVYSDDLGESEECTDFSSDLDSDFFQEVDVETEDDEGKFIAFANVEFSPTEATCGDTVTLSFDAYNVGEDDQDQVRINVYSKDLGIDMSDEIKQGLDIGDHQSETFTFEIPSGLADKLYKIEIDAEYDYRNAIYRESLDEPLTYSYKVFGCSNTGSSGSNGAASISAYLDSSAKAGESLVVTTTITNLLSKEATFVVDASGFSSWADLESISSRVVSLDAGESKQVTIRLTVDEDASGEQSFAIVTTTGSTVDTRNVVVNLAEKSASFSLGSSGWIWTIAAVNIILLLVIVFVAIRLSRN